MERYSISDLIKKWEREDATVEQVIGQLLLWVNDLATRVNKLEARPQNNQKPKKG